LADLDRSGTADAAGIVVPPSAWLFVYAVAAFPGVLLLFAASVPGGDYLAFLASLRLGALVAITWLFAFGVLAIVRRLRLDRGTWARWLAVPAMGVLAVAIALSGLPLWARFQASRAALEDAVARIQAGEAVAPGWIGLYQVADVSTDEGDVWFLVDGACFIDECGFLYVPGLPPTATGRLFLDHVDGPWWQWDDHW